MDSQVSQHLPQGLSTHAVKSFLKVYAEEERVVKTGGLSEQSCYLLQGATSAFATRSLTWVEQTQVVHLFLKSVEQ
jgi:hypothetical protein